MERLIDKKTIRVAIEENMAYWVFDNKFYKTKVSRSGQIDTENAEEIDVFSLSRKEMDRLLSILDSISD
jgi:hypothetical protein